MEPPSGDKNIVGVDPARGGAIAIRYAAGRMRGLVAVVDFPELVDLSISLPLSDSRIYIAIPKRASFDVWVRVGWIEALAMHSNSFVYRERREEYIVRGMNCVSEAKKMFFDDPALLKRIDRDSRACALIISALSAGNE